MGIVIFYSDAKGFYIVYPVKCLSFLTRILGGTTVKYLIFTPMKYAVQS